MMDLMLMFVDAGMFVWLTVGVVDGSGDQNNKWLNELSSSIGFKNHIQWVKLIG